MLWVFLFFAAVLIYLAVTHRLAPLEERALRYVDKLKAAYEYAREDVSDVEDELAEDIAQTLEADLEREVKNRRRERDPARDPARDPTKAETASAESSPSNTTVA